MAREVFPHYICDYCENEVVEKTHNDMSTWIALSGTKYGFDTAHGMILTYMRKDWNDDDVVGYYDTVIDTNVYFCCKECLIKYLLKHLGEPEDVPSFVNEPKGKKPKENVPKESKPSRFENIGS